MTREEQIKFIHQNKDRELIASLLKIEFCPDGWEIYPASPRKQYIHHYFWYGENNA